MSACGKPFRRNAIVFSFVFLRKFLQLPQKFISTTKTIRSRNNWSSKCQSQKILCTDTVETNPDDVWVRAYGKSDLNVFRTQLHMSLRLVQTWWFEDSAQESGCLSNRLLVPLCEMNKITKKQIHSTVPLYGYHSKKMTSTMSKTFLEKSGLARKKPVFLLPRTMSTFSRTERLPMRPNNLEQTVCGLTSVSYLR